MSDLLLSIFLQVAVKKPEKNAMMSDPATYPLMFIISCALCFGLGVGFTCLRANPDVRIDRKERAEMIRHERD